MQQFVDFQETDYGNVREALSVTMEFFLERNLLLL